uniref:Uncharacterized protein n=1 Tax=Arion vulgaris TaxID=1028688 RepID=A0A0B7AYE5_9EUPU
MLLAASKKYRWQDVAKAYLNECWRRDVMWYLKDDPELGKIDNSQEYRLENTFKHTRVSRNLLAFQVVFLDIALPANMTHNQIIQRYDENWGFPTKSMITLMKAECHKINNEINTYADWYRILGLQLPTDDEIYKSLVDAVMYAKTNRAYHRR